MKRNLLLSAVGVLMMMGGLRAQEEAPAKNYDTRWFISPLLKFQAQDFGMLEKNRKNQMSNAQDLSFRDKSTLAFTASVYKNFSSRLSMSMDLGIGRGHVAGKDELIETTEEKTYNLVNATLFYHLLNAQFRLQPFVSLGISNLMNDASYTSAPVGAGVKYSGKKIMVEAHAAYGYSVSNNIANNVVYNVGVYIPFKGRKAKQKEKEEKAAQKAGDTSGARVTNITNNYYFLIASGDSLKADAGSDKDKALKEAMAKAREELLNGKTADENGSGKRDDSAAKTATASKTDSDGAVAEKPALDPDDPMNLPLAEKSIVYFYYDSYSLTSSAFGVIDKVIQKMKENKAFHVHLKGYTDLAGSEQYNLPLSKKRAQMIFDYMNSRGIGADRIILRHYGKENPVINSADPRSAWQNRRCEIVMFEKR